MNSVNMHEAKTHLSRIVESLVSGSEDEVVIARNGEPAVRMTAIVTKRRPPRFGFAKGRFSFDYEAFQRLDAEVLDVFEESIERDRERGW